MFQKFDDRRSIHGRGSAGIENKHKKVNYELHVREVNEFFVIEIRFISINKKIIIVPLYLKSSNWDIEFESLKKL